MLEKSTSPGLVKVEASGRTLLRLGRGRRRSHAARTSQQSHLVLTYSKDFRILFSRNVNWAGLDATQRSVSLSLSLSLLVHQQTGFLIHNIRDRRTDEIRG